MFKTPRKSSSYGTGGRTPGSSSRDAPRGLFESGQWLCDCEPRLPAVRLQTKKKNANRGRWFYTCQKEKKKQCDFFIWEDAAGVREKEYLFNGGRERDEAMIRTHIGSSSPPLPEGLAASYAASRATQGSTPGCGDRSGSRGYSLPTVSTGDEMDFLSVADRSSQRRWGEDEIKEEEEEEDGMVSGARPSGKRKRDMFVGDSDEDEFGGGLGADVEREMLALAESATQSTSDRLSQSQATQRQASSQRRDQFATPSVSRTHDVLHGMATPNTGASVGRNTLLIATEQRDAKRRRLDVLPSTPSHQNLRSGSSTSTVQGPSLVPPPSSSGGEVTDDYPITEEVMALLGGVPMLDDEVATSVRRTLNDYALRVKGVERGRDMVRTLVKGKDAKIAELQARVAQLEQQRTDDRETIKAFTKMAGRMS